MELVLKIAAALGLAFGGLLICHLLGFAIAALLGQLIGEDDG